MAKYDSISIKSVIEDYLDFSGHEGELDETWVLKQANNACERFITDQQYAHRIAILDVVDFKAEAPEDFRYVVQMGGVAFPQEYVLKEQVSQYVQTVWGTGCDFELNLICKKCGSADCKCGDNTITVDVNRIYESAHPELFTQYMDFFYRSGGNTGRNNTFMYPVFKLMRKTSNSFFNIPYHVNECINLNLDSELEYDIKLPNIITNFKEGQILLSYMAVETDENGYRLVPNTEIAFEAINYYVEERLAFRTYRQTRAQKDRTYWQEMLLMRDRMIKRAKSQLQIPSEDEWWQFLQNHWMKKLPYYKWEDNYNRGTKDKFKYPGQTYNQTGFNGSSNR